MTTIANSVHHVVAILKLPTKVPLLLPYVQNIAKAVTGNPAFPNAARNAAAIRFSRSALPRQGDC